MALDRVRGWWDGVVRPAGVALDALGLTPNAVTALGFVLTSIAAGLLVAGRPVVAGWVLVAGGLADAFDGALARVQGGGTVAGAFFDSVTDRLSDGVILAAVAWSVAGDALLFSLAAVALVTAEVTSYIRAKAESLGQECRVGLVERAERAIALMAGLVLHRWLFVPVLWILAVGGTITVIQRVVHVVRNLDRATEAV